MNNIGTFDSRLDSLCAAKSSLFYIDGNGAKIDVRIQPRNAINHINKNPSTVSKLSKNGVVGCWVIGNDEFGLPIVMSLKDSKTYVLESDEMDKDEYLDSEIIIEFS